MKHLDKFYINGRWVAPIEPTPFAIRNPATDSVIGEVALGGPADVDAAVAAAMAAFETFGQSTKAERLALLERFGQVMERRFEELAQAISQEMGAPITFAREQQAACGLSYVEDFMKVLADQPEEETLANGDTLLREPIGVVALITPWNWPINQIAQKVLPALATGCCAILKPSEYTPLSAQLFAEFLDEAGCPPGVFNLVYGDGPGVGSAMSAHPDVDMVSFTGSTRAGKLVMKAGADTIKKVALELGGKSPNIVFADCDLETCVPASVFECFSNTGQSCNAPTRMLVERSCYDAVLGLAQQAAEAQQVGDPTQEGPHIGPLFDQLQYDRVQALIQIGIDEGATLLAGGLGKPAELEQGWYARPTIFADVHNDMQIARREIFGPVLVIIPFDTEEEAITLANDTDYGLAAYLQTGSAERARRVTRRLRAGTVTINGAGTNYGSPFGGYKQSGIGREGGIFGLEDFQELKVHGGFGDVA